MLFSIRVVFVLQICSISTSAVPMNFSDWNWSPMPNNSNDDVAYITRGGVTLSLCPEQHFCGYRGCHLQTTSVPQPALCQCDNDCGFFDDCCIDYADVCSTVDSDVVESAHDFETVSKTKLKINQFSCHEVKGREEGYLLVSQCSEHQRDSYISRKCSETNTASFLAVTHVTSLTNGVLYKNIYCAVCNNETMAHLEAWPVDMSCDNASDYRAAIDWLRYSTKNLTNVVTEMNCNVNVRLPRSGEGAINKPRPRPCFPHAVNSCVNDYTLDKHCKSYTAVMRDSGGLYKNPHCALCNSPNLPLINHTTCTNFTAKTTVSEIDKFDLLISIHLDLRSNNHVKIVRHETVIAEEDVTCPTGHVFDPFISQCRRLFCSEGYILGNNRCIPVPRQKNMGYTTVDITLEVSFSPPIQSNSTEPNCPFDSGESKTCLPNFLGIGVNTISILHKRHPKSAKSLKEGNERCFQTFLVQPSETYEALVAHLLLPVNQTSNWLGCHSSGTWLVKLYNQVNYTNTSQCKLRRINGSEYLIEIQRDSSFVVVKETMQLYPLEQAPLWIVYRKDGLNITKSIEFDICEKLSPTCPLIYLNKTLFRKRNDANESVEYIPTGHVFTKWEYRSTDNEKLELCSFLGSNGPRDTSNYTIVFFDYSETQALLSLIGNVVSMVAAGMTFLTYFVFDVLRNHATCCILNLVASLFMAQLLLLLTGSATANPAGCAMVAVLGHYFWLVNIFWTAILAYDLNRVLARSVRTVRHCAAGHLPRLQSYALVTWGGGAVIVIPCLVIYLCGCTNLPLWYGNSHVCWIGNGQSIFVVFGAPVAVVLLSNIFIFGKTVWGIRSTNREFKNVKKHISKARMVREELMIYIKIASLMGLTWIFGFAAAISNIGGLWFIFIILNSCQGVLIFLSFACTPRVRMLWFEAFCGQATRQRSYSLGMASSSASATRSSRL